MTLDAITEGVETDNLDPDDLTAATSTDAWTMAGELIDTYQDDCTERGDLPGLAIRTNDGQGIVTVLFNDPRKERLEITYPPETAQSYKWEDE